MDRGVRVPVFVFAALNPAALLWRDSLEWVRVVEDGASNTVVHRSYWVRSANDMECRNTQGDAQESFWENEIFISTCTIIKIETVIHIT